MSSTPKAMQILTLLENSLNALLQRLFPLWYATACAKEIQLTPIGNINPPSYLSHRWLSLAAVVQNIQQNLAGQEGDWQRLSQTLNKLITEREYSRALSILLIDGVEQCSFSQEHPSLISFAQQNCQDSLIGSAEDFDLKIHQAFSDVNKPHRVVYREWDGRYYWLNPEPPNLLASLQWYAQEKQRDGTFRATINVESLNGKALEQLRHHWWMVLLDRDSAQTLHQLLQQAKAPVLFADFEWRRHDVAFLLARKQDPRLNKFFLALLNRRSTQEVLDFGSYLSRRHYPFHSAP